MRSILNKIFSRRLGLGKFLISALAFLLGLSLVLLALQAYLKVNQFLSPKKQQSDYIILNKEVAVGHTVFGGKAEFSNEDVEELKQQSFVEELGIFGTSQFKAKAYAGGELGLRTDVFFESVPSQFIDEVPYNFKWSEGSDFIPMIISQDFLNLYNFGYALGRGTPQLSKSTIGMITFDVEVYGDGGRRTFKGQVVGFSERISSVLVPREFLNWGNKEIGRISIPSVSRVIVKVKSDQSSSMEKYFEEKGFKVSDDKLKFTRIVTIMNIVMSVLIFIGIAFMSFSMMIVILNFSLIVSEAKEEISLLLQLGYKRRYLASHLSIYLGAFIMLVALLSALVFYWSNQRLMNFLSSSGIALSGEVEMEVLFLGVGFMLLSFMIAMASILRVLRRV